MTGPLLSDQQWARVAEQLSGKLRIGRSRTDDRQCLEAVLHVLATGDGWESLPSGGASRMSAWRRLRAWQQTGLWPRIWQAYLGTLDAAGRRRWSRALFTGCFVPADKGERRWAPASRGSRRGAARVRPPASAGR